MKSLERQEGVEDRVVTELTDQYHRIKQSNKELLERGVIGKMVQVEALLQ